MQEWSLTSRGYAIATQTPKRHCWQWIDLNYLISESISVWTPKLVDPSLADYEAAAWIELYMGSTTVIVERSKSRSCLHGGVCQDAAVESTNKQTAVMTVHPGRAASSPGTGKLSPSLKEAHNPWNRADLSYLGHSKVSRTLRAIERVIKPFTGMILMLKWLSLSWEIYKYIFKHCYCNQQRPKCIHSLYRTPIIQGLVNIGFRRIAVKCQRRNEHSGLIVSYKFRLIEERECVCKFSFY